MTTGIQKPITGVTYGPYGTKLLVLTPVKQPQLYVVKPVGFDKNNICESTQKNGQNFERYVIEPFDKVISTNKVEMT